MRLLKNDFMSKYSDKLNTLDDVEFIEDISDSLEYEDNAELQSIKIELEKAHTELEQAKKDYTDIKEKYKQRFLTSVEDEKEEFEEDIIDENKDVIDIKEI